MNDPLEDRLREVLKEPGPDGRVDADAFLRTVHRGARRRRTVRAVAAAASVALVAGGGYAFVSSTVLGDDQSTVAGQKTVDTSIGSASSDFGPPTGSGTAPPVTKTGTDTTAVPTGSGRIVSLTATGDAYQWVLVATDDTSCATSPCADVYSTSGGGESWAGPTPVGVGLSASGSPDTVSQIRFARQSRTAEADGWAFGGALLSTHDDGRTWGPVAGVPAGDTVTHLEAWGDYVYATADGASPVLLRSPVGKDAWAPVAVQGGTGTFQALAASSGMAGFVDTNDKGQARVRVSTDDGVTWATSPAPCPGASTAQLSAGVASLYVSCGTGSDTVVQVTTDGVDWTTLRAPPDDFLLVGVNADKALAVTATTVYRLRPDGAPTAISQTPGTQIIYAGFTNEYIGYLIDESGQVWRTRTSGTGWSPYATHL